MANLLSHPAINDDLPRFAYADAPTTSSLSLRRRSNMPSASYRKAQQKSGNRTRWIIVAVMAVFIAAIVYLANIKTIYAPPDYSYPAREMGSATAKVVLEEFADYQCPYCGDFATIIQPVLVEKYIKTGKVRFIFRNFAFVDQANPNQESHAAANAALCAGEQNNFWQYHDLVFKHQTGENVGDFLRPNLISFAMQLNLDTVKFDQCLNSTQFTALMKADDDRATEWGVNSTPSFFINGQPIQLSRDMQTSLFAALDSALQSAGVGS
jgi:protein-disulfide isomerase